MERVKLYFAKDDDEWEDKGTGYLRFEPSDNSEKAGFVMTKEEDSEILLTHEIGVTAQDYTLQENSRIIRWSEPEKEIQHALSFENEAHCKEVFKKLRKATGAGMKEEEVTSTADKQLPELTLASLEMMAKMFGDAQPLPRGSVCDIIPKLVDIFQQCEDLEDTVGLENCCRLARSLVLHADFATAEELFSEENALHIIGALEYDPDIPIRIKHRQFLKEKVTFKEVVPISDPDVVRRIHQIYRMQYVKDVVLPRLMDEPVFSCLSHMIMVGNIDVVNALSVQASFFEELFSRIRNRVAETEEWRDLVGFLQEYCFLMRQLQPANQLGILIKMNKLGFFSVLTDILRDGSPEVKLKAMDILSSSMAQDPSALRSHIVLTPKHPLLQLLVETLVTGDAMGLTEHSLEVIKAMLEPAEETSNKYESFLEIFYSKFIRYLVQSLSVGSDSGTESAATISLNLPDRVSARAKGAILDLLSFCVQTHSYTIKYSILRENVVDRAVTLLRAPEKWLAVTAVRFIRTMVGMKDEFFDRIVNRNHVLGATIDLFLENGERNNMLNSSILELLEFVRKDRRHEHIAYVIEKHYDRLADITYVTTFRDLKNEYDKKKEGGCSLGERDTQMMSTSSGRMKRDSRAMEKEEEDYFGEGSDDNERMPDLSRGSGGDMDVDQSAESMDIRERATIASDSSAKRFKSDEASTTDSMPRQTAQQGNI